MLPSYEVGETWLWETEVMFDGRPLLLGEVRPIAHLVADFFVRQLNIFEQVTDRLGDSPDLPVAKFDRLFNRVLAFSVLLLAWKNRARWQIRI
jgi:hypothetical protein